MQLAWFLQLLRLCAAQLLVLIPAACCRCLLPAGRGCCSAVSSLLAEYDGFNFPSLDVDDSEELETEELDAAYRLHSPSMDSLAQQPHSAAAELQLSKDGNKLKLKLSKNSALSSSSSAPFFSASASFLSFQHHPAALLSFASHTSKALNQLDLEDLKALARDLHALQRESRDRALAAETELRKLHEARGGADGAPGIESEDFYQNAIKWCEPGTAHRTDALDTDSAALQVLTLSLCLPLPAPLSCLSAASGCTAST